MKLIQFDCSFKLILLFIQSISRVIFMKITEEYKDGLKKNKNYNNSFCLQKYYNNETKA